MSLQSALDALFNKPRPVPSGSSELERLRIERDNLATKVGLGEAPVSELHDLEDRLRVAEAADLVDDPFAPGQRVRSSLANVHPARRAEVAFDRGLR